MTSPPGGPAGPPAAAETAEVPAEPAVPRQLPTAVPYFAGRTSELRLLDAMLSDAGRGSTGVVISAIGGTAGVGKTALALNWAHRVAPNFPDGQLYANLRGFDPAGSPAEPADVLRGFLDALQVHPERFPATTEGLAALYRSLLADRTMLVLLDNAADVAQVRPLLPASPRCLVIVTSRRELSALAAAEGARLLSLDVLPEREAIELLAARLGTDRADAEPDAITQLATLCARLPLALSVIVARAAAAPNLPLAALVTELTELQGRLDALDVGDPAANVRTVFSLSYRHLPEAAARMFRLLGLHPGPDISAPAAASLAGVPLAEARAALRDLTRASLIIESAPGRYGFHDLLRAYAAEQAALREGRERREAIHRMLDHYLHTARRAHVVLYPGRQRVDLGRPRALVTPEGFGAKPFALAWLRAEYQVLLKIIDLAAREGFDDYAWRLPVVLWTFFDVCGHWHDGTRMHRTALEAARRCGDQFGQAHALRGLGTFEVMLGDYAQAHSLPGGGAGAVPPARRHARAGAHGPDHGAGFRVPGAARGGARGGQGGAPAVRDRAGRPVHAARQGQRAERVRLVQRAPRGAWPGPRALHAGDRAVPVDRLLPWRGRHLGHSGLRLAAPRRPRRGDRLLPACRRARAGDGQPLQPRDGARPPRRHPRVHR